MAEVNILIVEDDPVYANEAETMVKGLGYAISHTVNTSEAALKIIEKQIPDLILLDINIAGSMSGIEIAFSIKDLNIPIIFLTLHSDEEVYEEARLLGPFGFLIKPFSKLSLQSTIEVALFHKNNPNVTSEILQVWKEDLRVSESLFVKNNNKLFKVNIPDILVIEAEGNYSILNTPQKKYAIKTSLKQLKLKLSPRLFVQIHRNYIVQIPHIDTVDITSGEVYVNNKNYPVGGKFKHQFIRRLNQL